MLKTMLSSRDLLPRVILAFTVGLFLSCSAQISDAVAPATSAYGTVVQ